MSRKPVHKLRPDEGRAAVWKLIRRDRVVTVNSIYAEVRLGRDTIREYLTGLAARGYLMKKSVTGHRGVTGEVTYTLMNDCGVDAPRVRRDGTEITQGKGREQMWRALDILAQKGARFDFRDLRLFASTDDIQVSEADVKCYISFLSAAGYLTAMEPGKPGTPARYRMFPTKWTGPRPPQIQRVKQLYDPNLKKVVWSEEGGSE